MALRRLVSAARAIVTYQVGLSVGCLRVDRITSQTPEVLKAPGLEPALRVFREYLGAVRYMPISSERLRWNRDVLRGKDKLLEKINARFRDPVFEACYEIIDRWGEVGLDA